MIAPRVSVVVPNFNHGRFLVRRLESIYGQSFQNFEVLLLDDGSTDGSEEILRSYANRHPERTRLLVNQTNSGSPFAQWAKGIEAAKGQLVWIAETDDYCDEDFLAAMISPFEDPRVALSFAAPVYIDKNGLPTDFQYAGYTAPISSTKWLQSYVKPAELEVEEALGMRNTIPNASAALLRRESTLPHIADPLWQRLRVCGDWILYLRATEGHRIAFVREANAFFTHTPENTSASAAREKAFLAEHAMVVAVLRLCYPQISAGTLRENFGHLCEHFRLVYGPDMPDFAREYHTVSLGEHEDLAGRHADLSRQLEETLNSRSWRYSAPLRGAGMLARRIGQTLAGATHRKQHKN